MKEILSDNCKKICYCGHDCSKCITYIAALLDDNDLRSQSQKFYKKEFGINLPLEKFSCRGGKSENCFELTKDCPFKKCCQRRNIEFCSRCSEYPCTTIAEYERKYVNKCNQIRRNNHE